MNKLNRRAFLQSLIGLPLALPAMAQALEPAQADEVASDVHGYDWSVSEPVDMPSATTTSRSCAIGGVVHEANWPWGMTSGDTLYLDSTPAAGVSRNITFDPISTREMDQIAETLLDTLREADWLV